MGFIKTNRDRTYGGLNDEVVSSVLETKDLGFVFVGTTSSFGVGSDDMWLVKTDSIGAPQWNQTYGEPNSDHVHVLLRTLDGGFALLGTTHSYGSGGGDFWLIKLGQDSILIPTSTSPISTSSTSLTWTVSLLLTVMFTGSIIREKSRRLTNKLKIIRAD